MSEGRTDIKKGIFRRVRVLYALFFFVGMLIAGKILYLQYGPKGPALRNKGTTITYERVKLEADRGDVLACDGRILATSVPMYEVRMDFAANGLIDSVFLRDVDSLAGSLSSFFGDKSKGAYKLMLVNAFRNRKKNRYTLISPRRVNHLDRSRNSRCFVWDRTAAVSSPGRSTSGCCLTGGWPPVRSGWSTRRERGSGSKGRSTAC